MQCKLRILNNSEYAFFKTAYSMSAILEVLSRFCLKSYRETRGNKLQQSRAITYTVLHLSLSLSLSILHSPFKFDGNRAGLV